MQGKIQGTRQGQRWTAFRLASDVSTVGLYWESSVDGTVHSDSSKNGHCNFPGVGRMAAADLDSEFGVGVCRASIMSKLYGNLRFTACQHSGHPAQSECRSGAHEFTVD